MRERLRVRELEGVIGKLNAAQGKQHELDAALDDIEEVFSEGVAVEERISAMRFARFSAQSTQKAIALRTSEIPLTFNPTGAIVIPANASQSEFDFGGMQSALFNIENSGTIFDAGWALPTVVTTPAQLGPASGAGFLWIGINPSLIATWSGLTNNFLTAKTVLLAAPGSLLLVTKLQEPVSHTL